jgi:hypothetical protein
VPEQRGSRLVETVARLDLRDPANAAFARLPWPHLVPSQVRALRERLARDGTIERSVYSVSDTSRGVSGSISEGIKFGAGVKVVDIRRELVDASARTRGSQQRERFDCLDQLR